jgi:hypothetical protein
MLKKNTAVFLECPFTSRTIVVTALSGFTALFLGNHPLSIWSESEREMEAEQVTAWEETRLVIIDEISSASKHEIQKIHKALDTIGRNSKKRYGGLATHLSGLILDQMEPCMTSSIYSKVPKFSSLGKLLRLH